MKKLYLKNWRDIRTRKAQFIALVVLVAIGIASFVTFVSGYLNLGTSVDRANEELKLEDFSVTVISAPKTVIDQLAAVPGVEAVAGRTIIDTGIDIDADEQATVRVIGTTMDDLGAVNSIMVERGELALSGDGVAGVMHDKFTEDIGLEPGDTVTIRVNGEPRQVRIDGTVNSAEYLFPVRTKGELFTSKEFAILYLDIGVVERLFGREPAYNDISFLVDPGADRDAVVAAAEAVLEPYQIVETVLQEDQPSNFALHEEINQNRNFSVFMPFLVLVISSLSLFIALSRLVQSQRGEIGLAKALGYSNRQILVHYLIFSLAIAGAGAAAGFGLGHFLAYQITQAYTSILGIPFLSHQVHLSVVLGSVLLSTITCVLAGIVPALTSARMQPAKAMHADPNLVVSGGRTPLVERALTRVMPRSFAFRIPLRNIFRTRKRSMYTVIGIALAMILTVSTWAMYDSTRHFIDKSFNEIENWDIFATFDENLSGDEAAQIAAIDGIIEVDTALLIPARFEANGNSHEGVVNAVEPDADYHRFDIVEGVVAETALADGGLIMPPIIAEKLEIEVGDTVSVRTPYSPEPRSLELLALSDELLGAPIFTGAEQGRLLGGVSDTVFNAVYVDTEGGADASVRKSLFGIPGAETVMVRENLLEKVEEQLGFLNLFISFMLVFAFTMAFVVVYTTFTANVIERTREIATMRTLGEDRRHLAAMITLENLFLALAGIPIGLFLGVKVTDVLFRSFSTDAFTFKNVIFPWSYAGIVVSILVVLLLSEIPPIRKIFRLDLAEATKVME